MKLYAGTVYLDSVPSCRRIVVHVFLANNKEEAIGFICEYGKRKFPKHSIIEGYAVKELNGRYIVHQVINNTYLPG